VIDVNKQDFTVPVNEIAGLVTAKTKLIILNTPNNPVGYILSQIQLQQIFELAEKHGFFILADEIYEKLVFSGIPHFSIGSLEHKINRVFTVNGFSKSHAMTGWRLGYLSFPETFASNILKLQQHMHTNTCTFIQVAMNKAFDSGKEVLTEYNFQLAGRAELVAEKITGMDKLSLVKPIAGFFAFINISATGMDSNTFCSRLIETTGVATTPGIAFGTNWNDHVRLSFATSEKLLNEGLRLLKEFVLSI